MNIDERVLALKTAESLDTRSLISQLYPRLIAVHDVLDGVILHDDWMHCFQSLIHC